MTRARQPSSSPIAGGALRLRVRPGDGPSLADLLATLGVAAAGAAGEGRAFLNGRRAAAAAPIEAGDELVVHAARPSAREAVRILSVARDLVIADKPAGLPTTPDRRGGPSLLDEVARELGLPVACLHAASRLDVGVSGAVLLATTPEGAAEVARAKDAGDVSRVYLAVASAPVAGEGTWDTPIGHARAGGGRAIPSARGHDARPAVTRYRVLATLPRAALLELAPVTGRSHQLRVHTALAGAPLFGDRDHGGPRRVISPDGRVTAFDRVALHAHRVSIRRGTFEATSPFPPSLRALWIAIGGADDDLRDIA